MKKVLLLGYGSSLKALHELIKDEYEVYIYDDYIKDEKYYNLEKIKKTLPLFDIVVRSPGIKSINEIYSLIRLLTKELISEIEFCVRLLKNKRIKYILVTGSNGKTTTCSMIYEILSTYYDNVFLAGNIGIPFSSIVPSLKDDSLVILELSSYQIEDTYSSFGDYLIVNNIVPNHLDGVNNYSYYVASKKRISLLKKSDGILIVDKSLHEEFKDLNPLVATKIEKINYYYQLNIHFIYLISYLFNISKSKVNNVIKSMKFPSYRNELVKSNFLATIINDSKSTSVSASNTCLMLHNDKKRIIILGGIAKSDSFASLNVNKDDLIYIYGKDRFIIKKQLNKGNCFLTLDEIIEQISVYLNDDIYILFTPGCSSQDQFKNYLARGEYFINLIRSKENA